MERFSNLNQVTISFIYRQSTTENPFSQSSDGGIGAKILRLAKAILSPGYRYLKHPFGLICSSVVRLFGHGSEVKVDSLEGARAVLKLPRNGLEFHDINRDQEARRIGVSINESILTCEHHRSKHLRGIYQDLFGTSAGKNKIYAALHQLLRLELPDLHESLGFFPGRGTQIRDFTQKVAIAVIFGSQLTEAQKAECAVFFGRFQSIDAVTSAKKLQKSFRNSNEAQHIWNLMNNRGYSKKEQAATLAILLNVIEGNVARGLRETLHRCVEEHNLFADMRDDLEMLVKQGWTLEEAARKSDLVQSACVEALRVAPVVLNIDRVAAKKLDAQVFGLPEGHIQSGTTLNVSIDKLSQDEGLVGPEPKRFSPMRYTEHNKKAAWPAHKFLPFGYGPHQCPAWWLYKEVAIQVVAYLAYHYDWVSTPDGMLTPIRRKS